MIINNDDWEINSAIKDLNQLVGLEWEDIDSNKIADVNMKRMENLNLEIQLLINKCCAYTPLKAIIISAEKDGDYSRL